MSPLCLSRGCYPRHGALFNVPSEGRFWLIKLLDCWVNISVQWSMIFKLGKRTEQRGHNSLNKVSRWKGLVLQFFIFCLEFFVPLENFSLICRWKGAIFDLCSALMAIEQWVFFRVTRGICLWWSFLRTRDTHKLCRALGLSRLVFKNLISRLRGERRSNPLRHCGRNKSR